MDIEILFLVFGFCMVLIPLIWIVLLLKPSLLQRFLRVNTTLPTRNKISLWSLWAWIGSVVLMVAFGPKDTTTKTINPQPPIATAAIVTKSETVIPTPQPILPVEVEIKKPTPIDFDEGRAFAKHTLSVIEEAEQSLWDAARLNDPSGAEKYVRKPLSYEVGRWPVLFEMRDDDSRKHFYYCQNAAARLLNLYESMIREGRREQTVESQKYLRQDDESYQKTKKQCQVAINTSNAKIKATIAAEDAELKRKIGGRECMIVYDYDKAAGKVFEKPKPAHCK